MSVKQIRILPTMSLLAIFWFASATTTRADGPRVTQSADGTPIAYEVYGSGEPTLIFVHGWSCDSRYWRKQVPHFAKNHRVVVMDLAGHGHSGQDRKIYTMKSFGEDVRAVMDDLGGNSFILIGHSMGGPVIAQAARGDTQRIVGLIAADTFQNVAWPMTREAVDGMTAPLKQDFREGCRPFVASMINESTPDDLREWILADMSSAPPAIALSAMNDMMELYINGDSATIFKEISAPVVAVNADMWPTDVEVNRKHMRSFDVIYIPGADHFLMLSLPEKFNAALEQAIDGLKTNATESSLVPAE